MFKKMHEYSCNEEVEKLKLTVIDLQNKIAKLEKKGAAVRLCDFFSISFLATMTSALIVLSLVLLIFIKIRLV